MFRKALFLLAFFCATAQANVVGTFDDQVKNNSYGIFDGRCQSGQFVDLLDDVDAYFGQSYFELFFAPSGISQSRDITINGQTVSPTFRYEGKDATLTSWPAVVGEDLAIAGSGANPTIGQGAPFTDGSESVLFNAGKDYADGSSYNLGTDHFILEFVLYFPADGVSRVIIDKRKGQSPGWFVRSTATNNFNVFVNDGLASYNVSTDILAAGWYHILFGTDRSFGQLYVNGSASGPAVPYTSNNLDNTNDFTVGSSRGFTGAAWDGYVALIALYQKASWLDSHLQDTFAAQRFAQVSGMMASKSGTPTNRVVDGDMEAAGTAAWTAVNSAALSKESDGAGGQVLRVAYNGINFPAARQITNIVGRQYRITGRARGDGTAYPRIYDGANIVWTGIAATNWQTFDVIFMSGGTETRLISIASAAGYAEFDDISITPLELAYPTTAERASTAWLKIDQGSYNQYYQVGADWMRFESDGYLSEDQATNGFPYSEDFSTWTKSVAGDTVTPDAATSPLQGAGATAFIPDSTTGVHQIQQALSPATAYTHHMSTWIKADGATWAFLASANVSAIEVIQWFNIENCTVGSAKNGSEIIQAAAVNDGGGWCRIYFEYDGPTGVHTHRIGVSDGNSDENYSTGDGVTPAIYVIGAQHEYARDYMSSYIQTTGTAATRVADNLVYEAGENIGGADRKKGAFFWTTLYPNLSVVSASYYNWAINDGGSAADQIAAYVQTTTDNLLLGSAATGGDVGLSTDGDITTGAPVDLRADWATDYLKVTGGAADFTVDPPDGLDQLHIGVVSGANQCNCHTKNVRIR